MSDKVVIVPKPGDSGSKTGPELPPSSVQINSAEWQAANAKHQEGKGKTDCGCDCKITGTLNDKDTAKTVEELSKATSTTARLTAIGKLADGGVDKFSMKDKDGTTRQFRIETEKVGESTLLHCYGIDDQKQEQVVMRASRSADGTFKQQRYQDDRLASFHGDTWSKSMSGKSFLVGEAEKSDQLQKKAGDPEKKSDKKIEKRSTSRDERPGGNIADDSGSKKRTAHDDGSNGKIRKQESHNSRDRKRGDDGDRRDDRHTSSGRSDRRDDRPASSDRRDRGDDRHTTRDRERSDHRDRGSRFNLGETLGTVARYVAPFLLSALDRNRYSDDCNPYRNQQRYRSENGCRDFYDSNRYGYDGYRGQDFRGRQDHCRSDYDRHYGNRNYYDRYDQNHRNGYDRHGRDDHRHGRNDHQNRRSTNWLSKIFR